MTIFRAIVLGIIQGIAEFLPISSSAHLIIFPYLFGWEESGLAFDVALHFGTMMAVLVLFFKDWWNLFVGAIKDVRTKKKSTNGKMFWYLVVATIPAAITAQDALPDRHKLFLIKANKNCVSGNPFTQFFA